MVDQRTMHLELWGWFLKSEKIKYFAINGHLSFYTVNTWINFWQEFHTQNALILNLSNNYMNFTQAHYNMSHTIRFRLLTISKSNGRIQWTQIELDNTIR